MEKLEILEILTQKTDIKFELSNNLIYPKEDSMPLDREIIEYILSENFDLVKFQALNPFQMATSLNHAEIMASLSSIIYGQIDQNIFQVYIESMRVKAKWQNHFRIPDLTFVLLNDKKFEQKQLINPISIIEVLSPSTEDKDRNEKKQDYFSIDSLQEYVLIAQDSYKIEQFLRKDKTNWIVKIYDSEDQTCVLTVGVKIKLKDLYKNTDWTK